MSDRRTKDLYFCPEMDKGPIKPWILTALRMCRHSQEEEMTVVIHLGSSEERQNGSPKKYTY